MTKRMQLSFIGIFVVIFLFGLSGCATTTPHTQLVEIPVVMPCKVPLLERPAFAVDALPLGSGIWDQMQALRAERWQRQGYETELEAAVKACQ